MALNPVIAHILTPLRTFFRPVTNSEYLNASRSEAETIALQRRLGEGKSVRFNAVEMRMLARVMKHTPDVNFNDLVCHWLTIHYAAITGSVPSPLRLELVPSISLDQTDCVGKPTTGTDEVDVSEPEGSLIETNHTVPDAA